MPAERSESEGFYEMLWDCDHCTTKHLLALSQRHCPECGAPQNPDKRYYPPPGEQTRVDGHSYVGSDRHCPACSAPMSAKATHCTQCGSPLDGSKDVRGVDERTPAAPPKRKRRIWPYIVAAVVVIAVAIWWLFIRKHEATLSVAAHRWQCAIAIEQFDTHHEGAWCDQLPAGAEMPIAHRKQRSTRQIPDGEECHTERRDKKDGTFEQVKKCSPKYRSEPVDDNWCDFTIRKWAKVDDLEASGAGTTLACPTQGLPPADSAATLGARRAGAKSETRTLDFGDGGTCDVDDGTWRKYADGQKVKVEVRARSGEVVCSSL